jgi:hypothetical protein
MSSNDTLGHEVQKQFSHESSFVDAVKSILDVMSDEECDKMCDLNDGRSSFLVKMEELRKLSDEYCCFEGFDKVVALLAGDVEGSDNEEDGEDEDDEEEEDDGEQEGEEEEDEEEENEEEEDEEEEDEEEEDEEEEDEEEEDEEHGYQS